MLIFSFLSLRNRNLSLTVSFLWFWFLTSKHRRNSTRLFILTDRTEPCLHSVIKPLMYSRWCNCKRRKLNPLPSVSPFSFLVERLNLFALQVSGLHPSPFGLASSTLSFISHLRLFALQVSGRSPFTLYLLELLFLSNYQLLYGTVTMSCLIASSSLRSLFFLFFYSFSLLCKIRGILFRLNSYAYLFFHLFNYKVKLFFLSNSFSWLHPFTVESG